MVSTPRDFSSLRRATASAYAFVLVAPDLGVVLQRSRWQHEHVLVHQRDAELPGVDRASGGLYLGHKIRC